MSFLQDWRLVCVPPLQTWRPKGRNDTIRFSPHHYCGQIKKKPCQELKDNSKCCKNVFTLYAEVENATCMETDLANKSWRTWAMWLPPWLYCCHISFPLFEVWLPLLCVTSSRCALFLCDDLKEHNWRISTAGCLPQWTASKYSRRRKSCIILLFFWKFALHFDGNLTTVPEGVLKACFPS